MDIADVFVVINSDGVILHPVLPGHGFRTLNEAKAYKSFLSNKLYLNKRDIVIEKVEQMRWF
jgi:hypothetical protein